MSAFSILSSAKIKTRGLEVGQNPCASVHTVTEQLCGKHEVIGPDGNGDKHFEEPFCVLSSIILLLSGERKETSDGD